MYVYLYVYIYIYIYIYILGVRRTLKKRNEETLVKLCKTMKALTLSYGCENWLLIEQYERRRNS